MTADQRTYDIQVFSSASDAPRVRWRTDLVSAGVSVTLLVILAIIAGDGAKLDDDTLRFVGTLPGWLLWLGQAAHLFGVLYAAALLVGVGVFAHGRRGLLRDMLLAALLSSALVVVLSRLVSDAWPEFAFLDLQRTRDTFPAFSIAAAVALQAAASPYLTAPVRKLGWWFVSAGTIAAAVGAVTTVTATLGGVLVGLLAAQLIRYGLGTTAGLPSTSRVREGMAELGVEVAELDYHPEQTASGLALTGRSVDGTPLFATVLGSDSWNSRRVARWWRTAWYHDVGSQYGSDRRQQIEHEGLAMLMASRRDVAVPDVVAVGMTELDDAILVTTLGDHMLQDVPADQVDDALLASIWGVVGDLHRAGLSHGGINAMRVWIDQDGHPELVGFSSAALNPTSDQLNTDLAATLVMTTQLVGADRAIAVARTALGDEDLGAMLPMMQTASLDTRLRHEAKRHKIKVGDLRKQTAAALGIDAPEPEKLARVTWGTVVMTGFLGFAVYTIIAGLADVGFDTIAETLSNATWGLVFLGLVFAAATNYTDAIALREVSPKPVPVGVTTVEQFAIGFVNIAVPSSAGRIATNARFFQKFGISAVTSTATGAITGMLGFIAQAVLVVVTVMAGSGSIDLSSLQGGGEVLRFIGMAVVIAIVAIAVIALVPKLRSWFMEHLRGPISQLGEAFAVLKNPRVAIKALAASMGTEILYGAGFAMCVAAMGGSITLGQAVFINVVVSLFAGLMPIPGGIGITEAGMTAGLTAIGVPSDIAVGAVLVYRLVSYYLPPLWGYVSLRWLTNHDYL